MSITNGQLNTQDSMDQASHPGGPGFESLRAHAAGSTEDENGLRCDEPSGHLRGSTAADEFPQVLP